jgi:hypothetical protein
MKSHVLASSSLIVARFTGKCTRIQLQKRRQLLRSRGTRDARESWVFINFDAGPRRPNQFFSPLHHYGVANVQLGLVPAWLPPITLIWACRLLRFSFRSVRRIFV